MAKRYPENDFLLRNNIHLHVPEGATKKDGPSAGITMATALLSLARNHPIPPTIGMTGELSLRGQVLKIGGVKEKLIAAKRAGVETVLLPESNRPDYEDLEAYVKDGLRVVFVKTFEDVVSEVMQYGK
jgi:ATP-dependent Lon protease